MLYNCISWSNKVIMFSSSAFLFCIRLVCLLVYLVTLIYVLEIQHHRYDDGKNLDFYFSCLHKTKYFPTLS